MTFFISFHLASDSCRLSASAECCLLLRRSRRGPGRQSKLAWATYLATASPAHIRRGGPTPPSIDCVLRASETKPVCGPNIARLVNRGYAPTQRSKEPRNRSRVPAPTQQKPERPCYQFRAAAVPLQRPPANNRLKWATTLQRRE